MFVSKMFTKFHENIPDRVPYFSEVAALQVTALLKEGFVISIFQRSYKILRTVFLKNIFEWLLLSLHGATLLRSKLGATLRSSLTNEVFQKPIQYLLL